MNDEHYPDSDDDLSLAISKAFRKDLRVSPKTSFTHSPTILTEGDINVVEQYFSTVEQQFTRIRKSVAVVAASGVGKSFVVNTINDRSIVVDSDFITNNFDIGLIHPNQPYGCTFEKWNKEITKRLVQYFSCLKLKGKDLPKVFLVQSPFMAEAVGYEIADIVYGKKPVERDRVQCWNYVRGLSNARFVEDHHDFLALINTILDNQSKLEQ